MVNLGEHSLRFDATERGTRCRTNFPVDGISPVDVDLVVFVLSSNLSHSTRATGEFRFRVKSGQELEVGSMDWATALLVCMKKSETLLNLSPDEFLSLLLNSGRM